MRAAHISRKPTTQRICTFAAVGSASHWSAGEPAAEMSPKLIAGRLAVRSRRALALDVPREVDAVLLDE